MSNKWLETTLGQFLISDSFGALYDILSQYVNLINRVIRIP